MIGQFGFYKFLIANKYNCVFKFVGSHNRTGYIRSGIIIAAHCVNNYSHTDGLISNLLGFNVGLL